MLKNQTLSTCSSLQAANSKMDFCFSWQRFFLTAKDVFKTAAKRILSSTSTWPASSLHRVYFCQVMTLLQLFWTKMNQSTAQPPQDRFSHQPPPNPVRMYLPMLVVYGAPEGAKKTYCLIENSKIDNTNGMIISIRTTITHFLGALITIFCSSSLAIEEEIRVSNSQHCKWKFSFQQILRMWFPFKESSAGTTLIDVSGKQRLRS